MDKQDADKHSTPKKQTNFEDDMSYGGNAFQEKSDFITESDEQTELDIEQTDDEDMDQNEEELEKLRPQIELDISQAQDREDDPSFEESAPSQRNRETNQESQDENEEEKYINSLLESGSHENLVKQKFKESMTPNEKDQ